MYEWLSESLLGKYGVKILHFYLDYQLLINSLVIVYGIIMLVIYQRRKKSERNGNKRNK